MPNLHVAPDDDNESQQPAISPLKAISYVTTCTIVVAFASVLVQSYLESQNLSRIMAMASGLVRLEHDESVQIVRGRRLDDHRPDGFDDRPRVAIAYGACNDVYVGVADFLNYTGALKPLDGQTTSGDAKQIATVDDLLQSFEYYFARGAASE